MDKRIICLVVGSVMFLSACSGTYLTHYRNLKLAFSEAPLPQQSVEEVKASEVDWALVKSGGRALARISLAYQDADGSKWVSADNAMLVIRHGVVIKTLGFQNDLLFTHVETDIPLSSKLTTETKWRRVQDWEAGEYGYLVESTFSNAGNTSITIMGQNFETKVVKEVVTYQSPSDHWKLNDCWENTYWFDTNTGILLQSSQQASPFSDRFELQYISRAVRLM